MQCLIPPVPWSIVTGQRRLRKEVVFLFRIVHLELGILLVVLIKGILGAPVPMYRLIGKVYHFILLFLRPVMLAHVIASKEGIAGLSFHQLGTDIVITCRIAQGLLTVQGNITARLIRFRNVVQRCNITRKDARRHIVILYLFYVFRAQVLHLPHVRPHAIDINRHGTPLVRYRTFARIHVNAGNHQVVQ